MRFKNSSEISFNLDESKILSSGNGLNNDQWCYRNDLVAMNTSSPRKVIRSSWGIEPAT